ncbi:MAG: rhomboid family intramembrane serine protease [Alteromonas sp.]|uniref:rhomboid family intramembrane serine protease n=1 Tax=Alteromonas sp. MB-3u-76 TaxID=2058133 RepID=UPI000C30EDDA|nr:rhomboid family intramembrane serine protease [Alteromonas sp. MB-3u-76]AUC89083.1 rhomboid family intramembrane serine protease [Alteromonas sp. MB-3u-76]MAI64357.1 rhomboid family intramembrane serine protease [Alteromonas sp.]
MKSLSMQIRIILTLGALLILIEVANLLTGNSLNAFGVVPRSLGHLPFIFTAPFLHGTPTHLMANLLPLMLFMWLTMQWGKRTFIIATLCALLIGGLGVWVFGRSATHIGASGMVYGYFGFLVLAGFRSNKIRYLLISLVVAALYGGMLVGVLPTSKFISFEYHLFGFLGGLFAAWHWARK